MKLNSWNCVTRFARRSHSHYHVFLAQKLVCDCETASGWPHDDPSTSKFSLIRDPQWFPVLNGGCSWPGARLVRVRMLRNRPGYLWRWSGIPALQKLDDEAAFWDSNIEHFHHSFGRWSHCSICPICPHGKPSVFVISATEMAAPCPTTKVQQSSGSVVTAITPSQIVQGSEPWYLWLVTVVSHT